jgi:hypothetical protein
MAIVLYGRDPSLPHSDLGLASSGELTGCTYALVGSKHLWAYEAWMKGYKSTVNVTARIGVYEVDGSNQPSNRKGYSNQFTISTAEPGGNFGATIALSDDGPTNLAIPLTSGVRYHLAHLGTGGTRGFHMTQAAEITETNERIYRNAGESLPPPDPFGAFTSSIEGHMITWLITEENFPPDTPTNLLPSGATNGTTPTFSADFNDENEDRGDYLNQFKIQVRRVSDGVSFWDTTLSANAGEQAADAFSRVYAGTALVTGTAYEWRAQMSDHFGELSAWTAWTTFTPSQFGFVTLDGVPTGEIEDNTPDFQGRWNHVSAETMNFVQVQIWNAAGTTLLQTGAEYDIANVASSAAPGTLFTILWANTGLSTLAWGTSYQYAIRGKDNSGVWSSYSAKRSFNTNAAPTVPTNLSPANSFPTSERPLLTATATDADDTTATGFLVKARIKNNAGTVLQTRTMTFNAGTGKWEYQTLAADLATFATYRWDAYSYDGTLYSGEQTVEGSAVKSSEAIFIYAQGPVVSITSPTEGATITTAGLTVTWTVSGGTQAKYRVLVYEDGTSTIVYDSTELVSASLSHTIPSGYLRNDTAYDLVVAVEDTTPLDGQSSIRNFSVDYPPATSLTNVASDGMIVASEPWETAIRVTWDPTLYGTDVWQAYVVRRRAASGPDLAELTFSPLTSPSQVSFIDYTPVSGITYTYEVTQIIQQGLDELESDGVETSNEVTFGGVVLCDMSDPAGLRVALRNVKEREHPRAIDEAIYQPLSGRRPTTVRSRTYFKTSAFDAQLFSDEWGTAEQKSEALEALDENLGTICYRDERKRKRFMKLAECTPTDELPGWYRYALKLREESYEEGAA